MRKVLLTIAAVLLPASVPAAAQSSQSLAAARQAGLIGERYDGYVGFVTTPSAELRRQVAAVNLRRRSLYIGLSTRRNVTAEVVGVATACELLDRIGPGEMYMLKDGTWRRRLPGQPVVAPAYCGG